MVLVVDDEPQILRTLRRTLERLGYEVTVCSSPDEALAALEREIPDAIISDYRMPGGNGVSLLRHVRARAPHVKRILMSGYADLREESGGPLADDLASFISKPWVMEHLERLLGQP